MKNPEWAYDYAQNIIEDRWPEAERAYHYTDLMPRHVLSALDNIIDRIMEEQEVVIARKPDV
jgi:hypothetical protein